MLVEALLIAGSEPTWGTAVNNGSSASSPLNATLFEQIGTWIIISCNLRQIDKDRLQQIETNILDCYFEDLLYGFWLNCWIWNIPLVTVIFNSGIKYDFYDVVTWVWPQPLAAGTSTQKYAFHKYIAFDSSIKIDKCLFTLPVDCCFAIVEKSFFACWTAGTSWIEDDNAKAPKNGVILSLLKSEPRI